MSLYGNAVPLRESKMNAGDGGGGAGAAAEAAKTKKKPKKMLPQAPAGSQVSKRNTRSKRRNFRVTFWGYFDGRSDMKRAFFPRPGTSTVRV